MSTSEIPEVAYHHKIITSLAAGAIAGAIAKTTIAPLDRTKIYFQVSNSRFSFGAAVQFLRDTVRNEGVFALWRGNSATMARVIPYAATQFCAHEQWKQVLNVEEQGRWNPIRRYMAGSLAGVTAVTATYPLDMARARLAVTQKTQYRTLRSVFIKSYRKGGFLLLYRGLLPTVLGVIPYAGTSFFTYESLKRLLMQVSDRHSTAYERLIFGAVAGVVGQTSSYPFDIVRRRMQTGVAPKDHGTITVMRNIIDAEGFIRGLYKGLSMNWVKGPIAVGISFTTFDYVVQGLRHLPYFKESSSLANLSSR